MIIKGKPCGYKVLIICIPERKYSGCLAAFARFSFFVSYMYEHK